MRFTRLLFGLLSLNACVMCPLSASAQATVPANPDDDRLTFLLIQLGADEQSIKAVNLALRQAGYKVAEEQGRVQQYEKGNELMDRNAGGPVSYKDFYGKTAKDFSTSRLMNIFGKRFRARAWIRSRFSA